MKIAILGFADQGKSSYQYWSVPENEIIICDSDANTSVPDNAQVRLGKNYLNNLDEFDLLIRTPALHPRLIKDANPDSPNILDKVWTNTNEFLKACPTRNIIGITGTKGKGTTSTLVTRMLEAIGYRVHLGGNIGTPPLEMLRSEIGKQDWVVLELANFQLIDLQTSPHIATCLMIEPEHLNWHADMDEYIDAKRQLFVHQSSDDVAVFYADNHYSEMIAKSSKGIAIPYMRGPGAYVKETQNGDIIVINDQKICETKDIKLLGKHNWQNVCAAVTIVWNIVQNVDAIRAVIKDFHGLPHRLEKVRELNGVTYYNDSFSSAPGATIAAIEAIAGNKILIVGGVDKNLDQNELARQILQHNDQIRRVIIIGEIAERLRETLLSHGIMNHDVLRDVSMNDIVEHAKDIASHGDNVILSPGTSSFDMFKNFEDRGNQFKRAVNNL